MIQESLQKIGLSKKEAEIYIQLLRLGSQPASVISKKLNIPHSTSHFLLNELIKKKMATKKEKNKIFYFTAEDPKNICRHIEMEKENYFRKTDRKIKLIENVLPQIESIMRKTSYIPKMKFFEGLKSLMELTNILVNETDMFYDISSNGSIEKKFPEWVENYYKKIKEKKIKVRILYSKNYPKKKELIKKVYSNKTLNEVRFISDKIYSCDMSIKIYKNKIIFISVGESTPIGVLIESENMAKNFVNIFNVLWNLSLPIEKIK